MIDGEPTRFAPPLARAGNTVSLPRNANRQRRCRGITPAQDAPPAFLFSKPTMSKSRKSEEQLSLFFPNRHQNLPGGGERRIYARQNPASIAFFRFFHPRFQRKELSQRERV
jgi:hypothetical protein